MSRGITIELSGKQPIILTHLVLDFTGTLLLDGKPAFRLKESLKALPEKMDIAILTSGIGTIVAVAFFVVCMVVMSKMFWMLEQCVPLTQEAASKARARQWKYTVAGIVVGAWICAGGIVLAFNMPEVLEAVVLAGPITITFPVLTWVFLVY
jgi:uncharacterized membrane protein SirB2